jgi:hypothetical protein
MAMTQVTTQAQTGCPSAATSFVSPAIGAARTAVCEAEEPNAIVAALYAEGVLGQRGAGGNLLVEPTDARGP